MDQDNIQQTQKEEDSLLIRLKDFFGYFGPFLIFLGVFRLIVFYLEFNINIIPFLEFSEILTSFLDLLVLFAIQFIFVAINKFLSYEKDDEVKHRAFWIALHRKRNFLKRLFLYLKMIAPLIAGIFLTFVGLYLWYYLTSLPTNKLLLQSLLYIFIIFVFLVVNYEIQYKHNQIKSSKATQQYLSLMMWLFLTMFLVYGAATAQVSGIKDDHNTFGSKIILDDGELVSTENSYYIGKTQNFVFFYHQKENRCDILPMSRVRQLSLGKPQKINGKKVKTQSKISTAK